MIHHPDCLNPTDDGHVHSAVQAGLGAARDAAARSRALGGGPQPCIDGSLVHDFAGGTSCPKCGIVGLQLKPMEREWFVSWELTEGGVIRLQRAGEDPGDITPTEALALADELIRAATAAVRR